MTETYAESVRQGERDAFRREMDARAVRAIIDGTVYNGGASVSLLGATLPADGYMVGGIVPPKQYRGWICEADVESFISEHREALQLPRRFLGVWYDRETDTVWLDVSDWHQSREVALNIGAGRGEIAIYDLTNSQDVKVETF